LFENRLAMSVGDTRIDPDAAPDAGGSRDLEKRARAALAAGDIEAVTGIDAELLALPSLPPDLSVLRVDIARLRRSRNKVRDLTDQSLRRWFDAEPPHTPPASAGRMEGAAQIDRLSARAELVHHLSRQVLLDPSSFDQSARPSFHGLRGCCVLPRAEWAPVTPGGLVLARGMAPDARDIARVLGGDPTTGNHGLRLDDDITIHPDQRVIVIGGSDNWYHFVLDYLPRLLAVVECGLLETGWKVGLARGGADLFAPVVEVLGIQAASLIWLEDGPAHFFPRALFISNFNLEAVPHPHALGLLRRYFQPRATVSNRGRGPERLFVSRANIGRRRLTNEAALKDGLLERGFQIVTPENQTLREQIMTFQDAKYVVGVHGSALTNIVWCRDLKGMVELASHPSGISWRNTDPHFRVLCRSLEARHRRLRASVVETVAPGDHMSDFTLRQDAVFAEIDALIQETED
jgi:capsular polysaccharide biosynthesis protein